MLIWIALLSPTLAQPSDPAPEPPPAGATPPVGQASSPIGRELWLGGGVVLGLSTGFSGKAYLDEHQAADVLLTQWGYRFGAIHLEATYLYHPELLKVAAPLGLPADASGYLGAGPMGVWWLGGGRMFGAALPAGVDLNLRQAPLQLYAEVGLSLVLVNIPDGDRGLGPGISRAALGARYYFQ